MKGLLQLCEKYYKTKDLYGVLKIDKTASPEQIRKAFYKLSLVVHPDRVTDDDKEVATEKFKILGLVHSILSDVEKRKVYDETGTLDDEDDEAIFKSDIDWTKYWKSLYKDVTEEDIINYETQYKDDPVDGPEIVIMGESVLEDSSNSKGSAEETNDLKRAYVQGEGDMDLIFELVPFTHPAEEDRYRQIIQELIDTEAVPAYERFLNEPQTKKNRRKRKFEKEEKLFEKEKAKEEKKKSEAKESSMDLIAAIQQRSQSRESMFNGLIAGLEAKYGGKGDAKKENRRSGRKK